MSILLFNVSITLLVLTLLGNIFFSLWLLSGEENDKVDKATISMGIMFSSAIFLIISCLLAIGVNLTYPL